MSITGTISNPLGAFGEPAYGGANGYPMVNVSTTVVAKNSVVCLSSVTAGGVRRGVAAADPLVFGVLDSAAAVSSTNLPLVITEGFHLVAISSDAVPAVGDFLVVSTSTVTLPGGTVKTSTAATPIGTIIGVALSTALDSSGTFIPAYIHKM